MSVLSIKLALAVPNIKKSCIWLPQPELKRLPLPGKPTILKNSGHLKLVEVLKSVDVDDQLKYFRVSTLTSDCYVLFVFFSWNLLQSQHPRKNLLLSLPLRKYFVSLAENKSWIQDCSFVCFHLIKWVSTMDLTGSGFISEKFLSWRKISIRGN